MTNAGKWLLGCGIGGVAMLAVAGALLIAGGVWFVRETVASAQRASEMQKTLAEQFGAIDAYTPRPRELVSADRVEVFIEVRERSHDARLALADRFRSLAITPEQAREMEDQGIIQNLSTAWGMTSSGFALASDMGRFHEERNEALLRLGMGMGEYTWLYAISYWAARKHAPGASVADGAEFRGAPADRRPIGLDSLGLVTLGRVRDDLREMVRRAVRALPQDDGSGHAADYRTELTAELERLNADPNRIPWQDGLPDHVAAVLEPYREQLEETWTPAANPFELGVNRKKGFISYQLE